MAPRTLSLSQKKAPSSGPPLPLSLPGIVLCVTYRRAQGKFEDIGAEARKVFQIDSFEGIKAEYQRGLSNSFGVSHTVCTQRQPLRADSYPPLTPLPPSQIHLQPNAETPGQYEFGANYSAGKVCDPTLSRIPAQTAYLRHLHGRTSADIPYPPPLEQHLLLSRTLTSGDVLAQYVCSVTPNLTVRAQSQVTSLPPASHLQALPSFVFPLPSSLSPTQLMPILPYN